MFTTVTAKSILKMTVVSVALSAMMIGHSYSQTGGGGGGGGSSGGAGSPAYNGPLGPVPNNNNRASPNPSSRYVPPPHGGPIYNEAEKPANPEYNGCSEIRTSRNNTNQKGCDNKRLRVIVQ